MYPLGKPISQITPEDLARIKDHKYTESLVLDFKQTYSNSSEHKEKRELLKDIVAMANSAGGVIIVGAVEAEDQETGLKFLSDYQNIDNIDNLIEKYTNWIRDHTDDPITGVDLVPVALDDKNILLIEILESHYKPHRVNISNDAKEFYIRTGTTNNPIQMHMVKQMVLSQGSYWADCNSWAEGIYSSVQHVAAYWVMLIYPFDVRQNLFRAPDDQILQMFRPSLNGVDKWVSTSFDEKGCYHEDNEVIIRFYRNGAYRLEIRPDGLGEYKELIDPNRSSRTAAFYIDAHKIIAWASYVKLILPQLFNRLNIDMDGFISARFLTTPISSTANRGIPVLHYPTTYRHMSFQPKKDDRDIALMAEGFKSLSDLHVALRNIIISLYNAFGIKDIPAVTWNIFDEPWRVRSRFSELEPKSNQ